MTPKLLVPIGIAGCGKSTWIRSINQTLKNLDLDEFLIVSPDLIRKELTGSISDQTKNKEVFELAYKRTAHFINLRRDVIFDATNVSLKDRNSLLKYMNKNVTNGFKAYAKIFNVDPEICKARIRKDIEANVDRSYVPDEAIDKQYNKFIANKDHIQFENFKIIN
jgi:predicted kinase